MAAIDIWFCAIIVYRDPLLFGLINFLSLLFYLFIYSFDDHPKRSVKTVGHPVPDGVIEKNWNQLFSYIKFAVNTRLLIDKKNF